MTLNEAEDALRWGRIGCKEFIEFFRAWCKNKNEFRIADGWMQECINLTTWRRFYPKPPIGAYVEYNWPDRID
jgi:hypothetical protein